jgi:hypothetical protein
MISLWDAVNRMEKIQSWTKTGERIARCFIWDLYMNIHNRVLKTEGIKGVPTAAYTTLFADGQVGAPYIRSRS